MAQTVFTERAPLAIGSYVQGKIVGHLLFTSGQIPIDPETGEVVHGSIELQTDRVLRNLEAIVETAGKTMRSVVKTTCFLTTMKNFSAFNEVYKRYFDGKTSALPARSCVAVQELPKESLVEIEAIVDLS